ncbi:hypothetical protein EQG69_04880 [Levilactobacillus brevis]|uniref:hypothetical protein n=1 Tax=Levilactobacillus brevis TaxID=1580 RepID=UPI000FEF559F|nr:hypothetical protein [Levilactobacillus brevis]RWZ41069.1 hypothetical protein EQG69_04880 [Levilactobacillus brevis]
MQFDTTYLTEAGRSLATGTLGGLDKIQFTRAVASSHDYSATPVNDLKKLTSIEDVQQTVEYSRIIKKDDTTLTMRVDFPSKDVTTAYSLYTVGFYARPENGDEILYGVLPSSLPDYIAAYDGKSNLNDSFQTDTTVSDADNVLITVSQAGSLNEADLDAIFASKHIATIDDIKANIPATVIDGSKPADFKESVTLEKGAVDGAGIAIATAKDLADGDAETLTSAKEYADTQAGDKVKTADTVNWQKAKISADDGSPKSFLYAKDNGNITMWIAGRPLGMHTFWCAAGVAGNPVSSSIQDTMSISSVKNGVGYCVSADGDFISITLVDGQVNYDILTKKSDIDPSVIVKTTLTATDDVLNLDYGSYTISGPLPKNAPNLENTGINWGTLVVHKTLSGANKTLEYRDVKGNVLINILSGKPLTWSGWHIPNENSVVKDNGDSTVTVDGRKFTPADTDHTVPVSDAGVAGPANFAAGTLKVDDLEVLGAKVFSDTEDYKTFAAAHPSAITIVTHDTSTS